MRSPSIIIPIGDGSAPIDAGLWAVTQSSQDPAVVVFPPILKLKWPPEPPNRGTNSGPGMTVLTPVIANNDITISARVFSVFGTIQARAVSAVPPNNVSQVSLVYLGPPHQAGCVPLFWSVNNGGGTPEAFIPPWDGDYRVFNDSSCVTLAGQRFSGEAFEVPAGATRFFFQQARL